MTLVIQVGMLQAFLTNFLIKPCGSYLGIRRSDLIHTMLEAGDQQPPANCYEGLADKITSIPLAVQTRPNNKALPTVSLSTSILAQLAMPPPGADLL